MSKNNETKGIEMDNLIEDVRLDLERAALMLSEFAENYTTPYYLDPREAVGYWKGTIKEDDENYNAARMAAAILLEYPRIAGLIDIATDYVNRANERLAKSNLEAMD